MPAGGIGRGSNVWVSPIGSVLVSFNMAYSLANGASLPFVQYIVSLAVVRAIKSLPGCQVPIPTQPFFLCLAFFNLIALRTKFLSCVGCLFFNL